MALPSFLGGAVPEQPQSCTGHLQRMPMAESREDGWGVPHLPGPPSLRSACPADPVNIWVPGAQACAGLPGGVCGRGGVLTFWACSQGWSCPGRCGR